jgi:hypothetical protein
MLVPNYKPKFFSFIPLCSHLGDDCVDLSNVANAVDSLAESSCASPSLSEEGGKNLVG